MIRFDEDCEVEAPLYPRYEKRVGPHMARRVTDKENPVYRGVIRYRHRVTGEISYKYVGPYALPGAVGGILTGIIKEAERDLKWCLETNKIRREFNDRLPRDAEQWRYQKLVAEPTLEVVAVKRQIA